MKGFFKSFKYAFRGIVSAIKTQRNFRIHIVAMIYVTAFSFFYDLNITQYAVLILTFVIVVSLELVNTSLESVVDICSSQYSKLAEIAKDCSAGAVLVSAIGAVAVGILLFADITVLKNIVSFYYNNLMALAGFLISVAVSVLFIVNPFNKTKGK